jgi:hypothetical protein
LSDGRLLIGDRREFSIVVADFATGAVTPIGRRGSGPEEYRGVTAFMLLAGDGTLMADPSSRRWILFDGPRARTPSADRPGNRYDIVDRAGRLAGQLLLPSSERIIGTGKGAVYVLAIDTDGLQRVRRHPPP